MSEPFSEMFKKCERLGGSRFCSAHSEDGFLKNAPLLEACPVGLAESFLRGKKSGWDDCEKWYLRQIMCLKHVMIYAHRVLLQSNMRDEFRDLIDQMWEVIKEEETK